MRRCPKCGKWTLEFSEYFERFRCLSRQCGWMAPSSTERAIKLDREYKEPETILQEKINELGTTATIKYDCVNDALILDFGTDEASYELPVGDGRMIWKIGRATRSVTGFILLEASGRKVEELHIKVFARTKVIERKIQEMPLAISSSRPSQLLIERVEVASKELPELPQDRNLDDRYTFIFNEALQKIKACNGHEAH